MKYYKILISTLIFILMIIPLIRINSSDISERENRSLAKFPEYIRKETLNYDFGKEFENWLSDRFWGRNAIIDLTFQLKYKINGRVENDEYFMTDDGWIFPKSGTVSYISIEEQMERLKDYANVLKKINLKLEEKEIPLYVFILPERSTLYVDKWNSMYKPVIRINEGEELAKLLSNEKNIKIVNLTSFAKAAIEKITVYRKDDLHLTDEGVLLMLKIMLGEIDETLKNIDIYIDKNGKRTPNHYAAELGIKSESNETKLRILNKEYSISYTLKSNNTIYLTKYEASNPILNKHLYMIDGCFVSTTLGVLNNIFKSTSFLTTDLKDGDYKIFKKSYIEFFHDIKNDDSHTSKAFIIPNKLLSKKLNQDLIKVMNDIP